MKKLLNTLRVVVILLGFLLIDSDAAGTQLRRIHIEDFCQSGVCSGIHISRNDYVLLTHTPINQQTSLTFINSTIAKIPHLLFDTFPDLQTLRMENCSLETFEKPQFEGASYLMSLYLGNNSLRDIPRNIFLGADNLNVLSLANNKIRSFHNLSFSALKELNSLSLEGNQFERLTAGLFAPMKKLQHLNLARNNLETLPFGIFNRNTNLTKIDLSWNRLKKFESEIFKNLPRLMLLDISGNQLFELTINVTRIESFYANDCDIRKIDFLGFVAEIMLRNNSLIDIPYFPEAANVTSLDLSHNKLSNLQPNALRKMPNLIRLNISSTNLHDLPEGIFKKQSHLKFLDISDNSLYNLKFTIFDNLRNLEYFNFHKNNWNCDFLQLLMNSFVKRKEMSYLEDDIEPDMVDDFIDGIACWYQNNKSSKNGGGCNGGGGGHGDSMLELSIVRNDIKAFLESVDKKFIKLFRMIEEIKHKL